MTEEGKMPSMFDLEILLVESRERGAYAKALKEVFGIELPPYVPPTRRQRYVNKIKNAGIRIHEAWDVLRGNAYAERW